MEGSSQPSPPPPVVPCLEDLKCTQVRQRWNVPPAGNQPLKRFKYNNFVFDKATEGKQRKRPVIGFIDKICSNFRKKGLIFLERKVVLSFKGFLLRFSRTMVGTFIMYVLRPLVKCREHGLHVVCQSSYVLQFNPSLRSYAASVFLAKFFFTLPLEIV